MWSKSEAPGSALVQLHGFMGTSADWPVLEGVAEGVEVVALDLPGHGATPLPTGDFSMQSVVDWLDAELNSRGFDQVDLVGYSMGGRIAMHYALAHPDRCRRLVCISASPGIRNEADRAARIHEDEVWADRLESMPLKKFLEQWYQRPVFASLQRRPDLLAQVSASRAAIDVHAAATVLRALSPGRVPSLWDRLEDLPMPTMAIVGALDGKYVDVARAMAVAAENVSVSIVPDAGHVVHLEQETAFLQVLGAFLDYLPPARSQPQSKQNPLCP